MADVIYNPLSGVPPSVATRMKDCGDTTFAPLGMSVQGPVPVQSLTAQSALNTAGIMLDNGGVRNNHNIVIIASAGVTAGAVMLQGSQDNVNWFNLLAASISVTAPGVFPPTFGTSNTAQLTPVRYLRALITTAITGGTVSAFVASA